MNSDGPYVCSQYSKLRSEVKDVKGVGLHAKNYKKIRRFEDVSRKYGSSNVVGPLFGLLCIVGNTCSC